MTPPDQPMDISNLGDGVTTIMAEMDRMRHEIARLREENRSLTRKAAETAAACGAYQDRLAILRQAPRPVIAAMIAASDDWVSEAEAAAMIRAALTTAEQEIDR